VEISVVIQRKTLDETIKNLQEAAKLHLQGGNLIEHGLAPNQTLIATMELEPVFTLG
jgi:predicted RNase H-like HicB family nuclease